MQKQAVEMRFDGALGHVQIAGDFRVVTSLEQQIYDLPFPWSHLVEFLFHNHCHHHCTCPTPQTRQLAREPGPIGTSGFGSLALIVHSRGQTALLDVN